MKMPLHGGTSGFVLFFSFFSFNLGQVSNLVKKCNLRTGFLAPLVHDNSCFGIQCKKKKLYGGVCFNLPGIITVDPCGIHTREVLTRRKKVINVSDVSLDNKKDDTEFTCIFVCGIFNALNIPCQILAILKQWHFCCKTVIPKIY